MARKERDILEHAVLAVSEQAAAASASSTGALDADLDVSHAHGRVWRGGSSPPNAGWRALSLPGG